MTEQPVASTEPDDDLEPELDQDQPPPNRGNVQGGHGHHVPGTEPHPEASER